MNSILNQLHEGHPEDAFLVLTVLLLLVLAMVALFVTMVQVGALYNVLQRHNGGGTWQQALATWWQGLYDKQVGLKPLETEPQLLLAHNYDGITELDNHLPPWWKNLFYITIVFGIGYMIVYHISDTLPLQQAELENENTLAVIQKAEWEKKQTNSISELTAKVLTDGTTIKEGKAIYAQNCIVCHAADGGGGVGPNLTDEYYLHGNTIGEVFKTVKYGIAGKGMTAWQASLNPKQIQAVANYVLSLKGHNPDKGKAPQGIKIEEPKKLLNVLGNVVKASH